jgi:hypothetical protein
MTQERLPIVENNLKKFPFFQVIKSINGYNKEETITAYKNTKLKYVWQYFPTHGTLANFITKYNTIKHQIDNEIPFICFIEDDLELYDNFVEHIEHSISLFTEDLNIIRLDNWGEGYITSLNGAKRIKNIIDSVGIVQNIDNQLRDYSGPELFCRGTPWRLIVPTNQGDCLKTEKLNIKELQ